MSDKHTKREELASSYRNRFPTPGEQRLFEIEGWRLQMDVIRNDTSLSASRMSEQIHACLRKISALEETNEKESAQEKHYQQQREAKIGQILKRQEFLDQREYKQVVNHKTALETLQKVQEEKWNTAELGRLHIEKEALGKGKGLKGFMNQITGLHAKIKDRHAWQRTVEKQHFVTERAELRLFQHTEQQALKKQT